MGRYVTITYRLHELHVWIQGGYVPTTYPNYELMKDAIDIWVDEIIVHK